MRVASTHIAATAQVRENLAPKDVGSNTEKEVVKIERIMNTYLIVEFFEPTARTPTLSEKTRADNLARCDR